MAQLVISAAGAGVGFLLGGPTGAQIGWVAGSAIGSALFPTKAPSGPRLADLKVSGSAYGAPIPYVEGHPRVAGQVIWASDKYAVTTESGGKGGPNVETETTIYKVDLLLLLSSNEIAGVRRVWSNGALVWTAADDATGDSLAASAATEHWTALTVYGGGASQLPDPIYEAAVGPANAPAYRGRGTVMIEALNLGSSGILPNLTFELVQASTEGLYTSAILFAPLALDKEDDVTPTATATVIGSSGLSFDGLRATMNNVAAVHAVQIRYSHSGGKLNSANYLGQQLTIAVYIAPLTWGGNDPTWCLLFAYDGLSQDATFQYKKDGGTVQYRTNVYHSGAAHLVDHGLMPLTEVEYKIVLDQDNDTVHFYVGGTLIRTASGLGRPNGDIYLHSEYRSGYNVTSLSYRDLRVYVGSDPFTATTYTAEDAPLDDVVERLCVRAGLTTGQVDVTALAGQSVRSLAVAQVTPTRSVLELLAVAYQFEAVESLGKIKFVSRGGSSAATIAYASMGAGREGATAEPLPLTMLNDVETPAQVTVRYVNVSNDYQDGAESSDRLLGPGMAVQLLEVPLGLTPAEARELADVQVMDVAASQRTFGPVALSNDYAHLEPTDIVTLTDADGSTYRGRVLKQRSGGGVHVIEGVIEDASILTSTLPTDEGYDDSSVVAGAVGTTMELLDIPLLRDDDDGPGFYVAVRGAASPWPGCVLFGSADGVTYTQIGSAIAEATQIGTCTTTLGNWAGGTVFDELNSVTVDIGSAATLSSWSRDDILAGTATGYVVGDELLYARTATLSSPGVYVLTGLLRGRRGTEWAISGHGSGERFVALPASGQGLRRVTIATTDIGVTRHYKAVTAGRALSTATAQEFACTGVSQIPFAPIDMRADTDPGRDITLSWKRRTRYTPRFAGTAGINVPLGESATQYEVDILAEAGGSVVRTVSATAETCVYTAAEQGTDFGALQATIHAVVYQISASVGRGYSLAQSVVVPATGVGAAPYKTRPVMEMGGVLFAANQTIALSSSDDGQTYTVARDDGSTQVHTGVHFDAQLGTQRIHLGWNIYANFAGMIVGTTTPSDATTDYRNNVLTEAWYTYGYPRVSGAPIGVGALYSDGTYYYIVGRLADQSQTAGNMYLYRATTALIWTLQGQMEQDGADPNELPANGYGAFRSYWFTPNSTGDSIYNSVSRLQQLAGRWFLRSSLAIYYTDDAAGLTGWLRCPTGLGEEETNPPISLLDSMIEVSSTLLVARSNRVSGDILSISTDNGETWTTSRPIVQFGDAKALVSFGTTALLYYTYNGLLYVASASSPFTSWSVSLVDGIAPGASIADIVVTSGGGIAAWTERPTGGGWSEWALVYSADGITFVPASITP